MSKNISRIGNRWTVNECLQLQREFELLNMSIDQIAEKHRRTPNAIMFKLNQEGFADYNSLRSMYDSNKYMAEVEQSELDDLEVQNDLELDDSEEELDDSDFEQDNEYNNFNDMKQQFLRLEKKVMVLTEMFLNNRKGNTVNKSIHSFLS